MTKRTVFLVLAAGLAALLLGGCGDNQTPSRPSAQPAAQQFADVDANPTPDDATGTKVEPPADPTPKVLASPAQTVTKTVAVTRSIGFTTRTVKDSSLAKGKIKIKANGKSGVRTLTYRVTLTGGKQTAKRLIKSVVTRKPVIKLVAVGTKQAGGGCDPNYSGACVPVASDVDCAGGGGNGPAFVRGPVRVVGSDIYKLDRDGDGVACDD